MGLALLLLVCTLIKFIPLLQLDHVRLGTMADLFHIPFQVSADLRRVGYFLGSPAIKRLVFRKAQDGRWKELVDLVQASAKRKEVGKKGGESLEEFAHVSLLEGLELDREDIRQTFWRGRGRPKQTGESEPTQEQDQTSEEIRNLLRGRKRIRWDAPENTNPIPTSPDEYLQPSTNNNESWDSVIGGSKSVWAIQLTRNTQHGIKVKGIEKLLERAGGRTLRMLHVVP